MVASKVFTTSLAGIDIGADVSFNKDNIWKACVWLQQSYQALVDRIFGANNDTFNAAQNLMIGIIEKLINELNRAVFLENFSFVSFNQERIKNII